MDSAVGQVNRGLVRPVTIAAALIGTVEALTWTCFSLISILYYNSVLIIDDLPETSYRRALYEIFLDKDSEEISNKIIVTPNLFSLFMYIYLVLSFVWLISSLYMFWAMTRNKWSDSYLIVGGWAGVTIILSLLDAAMMSLIVADFVTVQDAFALNVNTPTTLTTPTLSTVTDLVTTTAEPVVTTISTWITSDETVSSALSTLSTVPSTISEAYVTTTPSSIIPDVTTTPSSITDPGGSTVNLRYAIGPTDLGFELSKDIVYVSYGIVMSLAARGYILWIVNVIFACVLLKFAYDLKKEEAPSLLPILDAYASGRRPWNNLYEQTDISNGYSNEGFKGDSDGMFPRSDSFVNSDPSGKNRNPLSSGANPYDQPVGLTTTTTVSPNPNIVNGRVAKIGKSGGRRTPPQNVPPPSVPANSPYIPDPDYTPPPSPKPKSVLRPKSNYVL